MNQILTSQKQKINKNVAYQEDQHKPFIEHLQELRKRLFFCIFSILIGGIIGYSLYPKILSFLLKPLNQPLYYTSPAGGFDLIFKICVFFGILCSIPVFIYNLYKFFQPVITNAGKKLMFGLIACSTLLMGLGLVFAYYISLPAALHFLNEFSSDQVKSLISTKDYFSFISIYLVGFGIIFQLPLIMVFINRIHRLETKSLMKFQKWIILLSFISAAIITPTPDPVNQIIMAIPIILLYQVSILLIWYINKQNFSLQTTNFKQKTK